MKISEAGIALVRRFEGCRLHAYLDAVGVPTIGYGSTEGVTMGDTITQEEAETLLLEDLARFEKCVNEMVKVPIDQNAFDALVSFAYNLGCGNLRTSTLLKRVNEGDFGAAANEFKKWRFAGAKELPGLVARRAAEAELFMA